MNLEELEPGDWVMVYPNGSKKLTPAKVVTTYSFQIGVPKGYAVLQILGDPSRTIDASARHVYPADPLVLALNLANYGAV